MSLIFITGVSGTGKSTVCQGLKSRGYEAYDVDDDGLGRWQNKESGYIHPKSSIKAHQRTQSFLDNHLWVVPRQKVEDLAKLAMNKKVFLCGVFSNENEMFDLFSKIIALTIDKETLINRIKSRTNNDFGKSEHELIHILDWHKEVNKSYKRSGHVIIDSTKGLDQVIDDIIKST